MIKGLFETHIEVGNLERSIEFYRDILGLFQCHLDEVRRIAFFWVGEPGDAMLGLWEKAPDEVHPRHFAFRCEVNDIIERSVGFLHENGLKPYNFLKTNDPSPMVFAWMPALAIYFDDPDGNVLEFIAMLDGQPKPTMGVISYEHWIRE